MRDLIRRPPRPRRRSLPTTRRRPSAPPKPPSAPPLGRSRAALCGVRSQQLLAREALLCHKAVDDEALRETTPPPAASAVSSRSPRGRIHASFIAAAAAEAEVLRKSAPTRRPSAGALLQRFLPIVAGMISDGRCATVRNPPSPARRSRPPTSTYSMAAGAPHGFTRRRGLSTRRASCCSRAPTPPRRRRRSPRPALLPLAEPRRLQRPRRRSAPDLSRRQGRALREEPRCPRRLRRARHRKCTRSQVDAHTRRRVGGPLGLSNRCGRRASRRRAPRSIGC